MSKSDNNIEFLDNKGSFRLINPVNINELYFPLCNEAGIMSSVTPLLHGDSKTSQQNFILQPVTIEDLHSSKATRNFWFFLDGKGAWSATGNSAEQTSKNFSISDNSLRTIEAGLLWHKLIFNDENNKLTSEILSFVPCNEDKIEIMLVTLTNNGNEEIKVTPTSAIPLFGRSAENIRDHRHVTSLVNRMNILPFGLIMKPEIIFDEKGHKFNSTNYFVLGCEENGELPAGFIPDLHSFIGKSGSLDWPEAIIKNINSDYFKDEGLDGKEYIGAIRFKDKILKPGEKIQYIVIIGVSQESEAIDELYNKYNNIEKIKEALSNNEDFWSKLAISTIFESGLNGFTNWMRWVSVQPVFRKIYGCSFLPYHDYGKGGRGWRDLWQDLLSLILQNPIKVRKLLIDNFAGVRVDGTNATIIGTNPGEFKADRNNISRVWMDHGSWPYLTTKQYIDQSGDFNILLENQVYFKDAQIRRAKGKDASWRPEQGTTLKTKDGCSYTGTILEHILIQHLISFFNVGEHNIIKLEGADWNDTLDMARERGESTAFTALYGSNLISLSELIFKLIEKLHIESLELFEEMSLLFDTLLRKPNYNDIEYKNKCLEDYYKLVESNINGVKQNFKLKEIALDLKQKGAWIFQNIRKNEWIETKAGDGFFNGYYNNDGHRVDGENEDGIRMNLTAQVFTTMFGLATDSEVDKAYKACIKYLKDPNHGGIRLNTNLGNNKLNFGRCFAFAYGEKENGSTFCHMAVMYMNALYKRNFVTEAYDVFKSLFDLSMNVNISSIYPGIPEYFSLSGKGMYSYLTGSASWLLMTVLNEMYGVRGEYGDLVIEPKLKAEQFDKNGRASVNCSFKSRRLKVLYLNSGKLDYIDYHIGNVSVNSRDLLLNDKKLIKITEDELEMHTGLSLDVIITLS